MVEFLLKFSWVWVWVCVCACACMLPLSGLGSPPDRASRVLTLWAAATASFNYSHLELGQTPSRTPSWRWVLATLLSRSPALNLMVCFEGSQLMQSQARLLLCESHRVGQRLLVLCSWVVATSHVLVSVCCLFPSLYHFSMWPML